MRAVDPVERRFRRGAFCYLLLTLVLTSSPFAVLAVLAPAYEWWGIAWWAVALVFVVTVGPRVLARLTGTPRPASVRESIRHLRGLMPN